MPEEVVEDGRERAQFDRDAGVLTVYLPKLHKGQFFSGLDMVTTLLAKRPGEEQNTGIEVLDSTETPNNDGAEFTIEQTLPQEEPSSVLLLKPRYGFNNLYSNFFPPLQEDLHVLLSQYFDLNNSVGNCRFAGP